MLEYYFLKGLGILECDLNNLAKFLNEVKQSIYLEETHISVYVMTCINKITSTSNTLKKLLLHKSLHYSYIKTEYNNKADIINNTFITYVEPLINDINYPALIKEWKIDWDVSAHGKKIYANVYKPSAKQSIYCLAEGLYTLAYIFYPCAETSQSSFHSLISAG